MERFTEKVDNEYIVSVSMGIGGYTDVAEEKQYEANQKLGRLEDIEQVLKKGFYYRGEDEYGNLGKPCYCKPENIWAGRSCFLVQKRTNLRDGHFKDSVEYVSYKGQGKTWALTKEELEVKKDV